MNTGLLQLGVGLSSSKSGLTIPTSLSLSLAFYEFDIILGYIFSVKWAGNS